MALARSASGPGGLSINTASANSLFGSTTATTSAPPAAGMFGSTPASKPLFGAVTTTTAPATGGLFGSSLTTQPQASGGLFGAASQTQPQTGSLFGSTMQPQPQAQTGGLFGSTAAQPPTSSQQQAGGLFGATTTQAPGAGLFGSNQPTASSLFGGTMNTQAAPSTNLFGSLGATRPGSSINLPPQHSQWPLGQSQPQSQNTTGLQFGGLTMGQGNQPQVVPGVRIDTANIRGTTRFSDLQSDLQQQIEDFDKMIQGHMSLKEQIGGIVPKHQEGLNDLPESVELCRRKLIGAQNGMASDVESIASVQGLIKSDAENAHLSIKAIENLKLPQQYHIDDGWHSKSSSNRSQDDRDVKSRTIVDFVSSTADELGATLTKYQEHITEIELHLRGVEANSAQQINALIARRNNGGSGTDDDAVRDLAATLTDFEQGILHVAGKIGEVREGVQTLQLGSFTGTTNGKGADGKRSGVY